MDTLFTTTQGNGKPIVLLHGFCEDGRIWGNIVPTLAQHHQVITVEVPGFGKSELNANSGEVSIAIMAARLQLLLQATGIDTCTLIGHSLGGYITLAFAEKYPTMLSGWGLFHSTAYADSEEKKENRLKQVDFIERNGVTPFVKTLIPSLFSSKHNYSQQIENSLQIASGCSALGITNALHAMRQREEKLHVLKNSTVPVLLIAGADDTVVSPQQVAYQASLAPIAQFELFENSGHMGFAEEPQKSIAALNRFMALCETAQ